MSHIVLPNIDLSSMERLTSLAESDPNYFFVANGLHPTSVNADYKAELDEIFADTTFGAIPNVVAIGEIGMDFCWSKSSPKNQEKVFRWILDYCNKNV